MKSGFGVLSILMVLTGSLYGQTLYVDDDAPGDPGPRDHQVSDPDENGSAEHPFDDVQEAIDAASAERETGLVGPGWGQTIIVAPGRYLSPDPWAYDEINFKGKNIHLISSAPTDFSVAEQTVLCGTVVFKGTEASECLLQGFKIQNHGHGGIVGNGTRATISHCIISGNGPCDATVVKDCHGLIKNCLIVDNTASFTCAVLPVMRGCGTIINCTIANNFSGVNPPAGGLSSLPLIRNCIIYGNQGPQLILTPNTIPNRLPEIEISHCLIEGWSSLTLGGDSYTAVRDADPCFVRPGNWTETTTTRTLSEGDYHLRSKGFRWSDREMHGSHWYFDLSTSPGVDGGHPMDGLGEELERTPDDPEGLWGVNHAIDMGAYGGTTQASLAPNRGDPPGIDTVNLRDYWPIAENNQWGAGSGSTLTGRGLTVEERVDVRSRPDLEAYKLHIGGSGFRTSMYCAFTEGALYMTADMASLLESPVPESILTQYPQYLTVGSTIRVPEDPFTDGTVYMRSVTVVRGTLEEAYAGAAFDSLLFASSPVPDLSSGGPPWMYHSSYWPDVIAFRPQYVDGTLAAPIAIFARGFGPLILHGRPVDYAVIDDAIFTR